MAEIKLNGCTRIVFLIGKWAIKIPNFTVCHEHFLKGCLGNWSERNHYKTFKSLGHKDPLNRVAPSLFCSWFGLIQIQIRCSQKKEDLTIEEGEYFKELCGFDNKKENFGYLKGRLVCIDYA